MCLGQSDMVSSRSSPTPPPEPCSVLSSIAPRLQNLVHNPFELAAKFGNVTAISVSSEDGSPSSVFSSNLNPEFGQKFASGSKIQRNGILHWEVESRGRDRRSRTLRRGIPLGYVFAAQMVLLNRVESTRLYRYLLIIRVQTAKEATRNVPEILSHSMT